MMRTGTEYGGLKTCILRAPDFSVFSRALFASVWNFRPSLKEKAEEAEVQQISRLYRLNQSD